MLARLQVHRHAFSQHAVLQVSVSSVPQTVYRGATEFDVALKMADRENGFELCMTDVFVDEKAISIRDVNVIRRQYVYVIYIYIYIYIYVCVCVCVCVCVYFFFPSFFAVPKYSTTNAPRYGMFD